MNLRRRLLALLVLAPVAAWAQPAAGVYRIGTLSGGLSPKTKEYMTWQTFFDAMHKLGYEEGRNVVYEMRYAEGTPARFPQLASELVAAGVQLIAVTGSPKRSPQAGRPRRSPLWRFTMAIRSIVRSRPKTGCRRCMATATRSCSEA